MRLISSTGHTKFLAIRASAACLSSNEHVERGTDRDGGERETEVIGFYNLIQEGLSHYFCHILFIRSKSIEPGLRQEKEFPRT